MLNHVPTYQAHTSAVLGYISMILLCEVKAWSSRQAVIADEPVLRCSYVNPTAAGDPVISLHDESLPNLAKKSPRTRKRYLSRQ